MPDRTTLGLTVDGRHVAVSNLDKVLYPATGTTKGEVIQYYATIAPAILPLLEDRPLTRIRFPSGVEGTTFFEKNMPPGAPSWMASVTLDSPGSSRDRETITYPLIKSVAGLVYLANLASLELHTPQWRVDEQGTPQPPNRLVIDLDPGPPAGLGHCAAVALQVRDRLESHGLTCHPVTSGSKGMQLYAPLDGTRTSEDVRDLAKDLAQSLTRENPELVVWKMTRDLRPGKVLLDWSQNSAAKTTICPWSLRGKERPQVACPRTWEELERGARTEKWLVQITLDEALRRYEELGNPLADALNP